MEMRPMPMKPRLPSAVMLMSSKVSPMTTIETSLAGRNPDGEAFAGGTTNGHDEELFARGRSPHPFFDDDLDSIASIDSMGTIDTYLPQSSLQNEVTNKHMMMDDFGWITTPTRPPCQYPRQDLPPTDSPFDAGLEHTGKSSQHQTKTDSSQMCSLAIKYLTPVHIALSKGTSLPVLKAIVQAYPGVLLQKDGTLGLTPLALSLKASPQDKEISRFLLDTQPLAASIPCNHTMDLPLHMACREQAEMDLVVSLLGSYPFALHHSNIHGLLPYDIVQRQSPSSFYRNQLLQLLQEATIAFTEDSMDAKFRCESVHAARCGIRTSQGALFH